MKGHWFVVMAGEIEILAWVHAKPDIYQSFWLIDYYDQSYPCLRRFMNLSILPDNRLSESCSPMDQIISN